MRSSATAEDSASASFAGQHDSYLDIRGALAILHHVRRCWASLYTERAVTYRTRNGIDHRTVAMAVIVQRMISPNAAGILFTADPLTGNRTVASVEASPGLGEGLVSGLVSPDVYTVRDEVIAGRRIATTQLASRAGAPSDAQPLKTVAEQPTHGVLTDDDIVRLVQLGRRIEAHFGAPQDIEWCLVADDFYVVQSRPITTIFPVPLRDDSERHVYISVGHQQMMTDAMPPLGISLRQLTGGPPFHEAGGRVFVDVSQALASSAGRAGLLGMLGKSDPLIGDALETVIERGFIALLPEHSVAGPGSSKAPIPIDPAIVAELIGESERSVATLKRNIEGKSGMALLDFILADFQELKRILFDPRSHQAIMAGMEATWWLNEHLHAWLGEPNAADVLAQSVPNNVTSEMGLALLDVADVIRPHGEVVESLQRVEDERFLAELPRLSGGSEAREAINAWLEVYGMRGAGEIDITRPRWSERPSALVPLILANIKNFEPGERKRRFERGQEEAQLQEDAILRRVRMLPDGDQKAEDVKQMIDRLRTFIGYREYPKYGMMSRYLVYKLALMSEAERLVAAGVLRAKEDVFYLTLPELRETVRTNHMDQSRIAQRKDAFKTHQLLTPPRVLTSEGEAINGSYRRHDVPSGALVGLAVSGGVAEGRARVILDMTTADLEVGDILVTTFTDPSWTPLFVAIKGLVTEVGGTMTHGSVIAREYGLPAVVSVEHATRRIRDGQQIRVHGTAGYVELL